MTRMTARQLVVLLLFAMEENPASPEEAAELFFSEEHYASLQGEDKIFEEFPDEEQMAYIRRVTDTAIAHQEEIDAIIEKHAQGWRKDRLARTTLAILRCALCEICYLDDISAATAVNEAVEQGKRYDSPKAAAFINGVLGSYLRDNA